MRQFPIFTLCVISAVAMNSCGLINRAATNTGKDYLANAPYDVIIVPGLPFTNGKVNPVYKGRMLWAKWLFDRKVAKNIIFSGSAVHTPFVEAQAMKIMADSLGIPSAHTFIETRAEHSTENVQYGILLAHQLGFKKIAVATDPFQSHYIKRFLQKTNNNIALLPFRLQLIRGYFKQTVPEIDATDALVRNHGSAMTRDVARKD